MRKPCVCTCKALRWGPGASGAPRERRQARPLPFALIAPTLQPRVLFSELREVRDSWTSLGLTSEPQLSAGCWREGDVEEARTFRYGCQELDTFPAPPFIPPFRAAAPGPPPPGPSPHLAVRGALLHQAEPSQPRSTAKHAGPASQRPTHTHTDTRTHTHACSQTPIAHTSAHTHAHRHKPTHTGTRTLRHAGALTPACTCTHQHTHTCTLPTRHSHPRSTDAHEHTRAQAHTFPSTCLQACGCVHTPCHACL